MGIDDRDYYHEDRRRSRVGAMRMGSVTTWLIALNVAVFILDAFLRPRGFPVGRLWLAGYFSASTALYELELWRFLTFQFLHADITHLFFNMLSLYFFGYLIEGYLGSRRYLAFYLLCGIAGAVAYLLLWAAGVLIGDPRVPMVGASAGIFGVLFAAARVAPDTTVMLMFPPIPMKLKVLALVLAGVALVTVLTSGRNAGGEAAHLGGAALGSLLIQFPQVLNVFDWRRMRSGGRRTEEW